MTRVQIDLAKVDNWAAFHAAFAQAMGFPDFYGDNMNAWEDCMSDLSRPGIVGMTKVIVPPGEDLVLEFTGSAAFRTRQPDIFDALLNSTTNVNVSKANIPSASLLLLLLL